MSQQYYNRERFRNRHRDPRDKFIFGVGVALIGVALMFRSLGLFWFSYFAVWPMILIAVGLLIGLRSAFRNPASWILLVIGIANLTPEFYVLGHPSSDLVWPALVILGGIFIAFRASCKPAWSKKGMVMDTVTTSENTINADVTFGGRKEFVTSKDFKGGTVSATFGGVEINLMQADTTEKVMVLDIKISFGGVELIVPSNWEIKNEISPSFGSVEDERMIQPTSGTTDQKILLLKGNCSFGSVEIKSF